MTGFLNGWQSINTENLNYLYYVSLILKAAINLAALLMFKMGITVLKEQL